MRFAVLGRLEIHDEDRTVRVEAHKQRILLATLISRVGRPVTADVLIEALWGADRPKNARKALGWHVLRLRTALGGTDSIDYHSAGYLLQAAPDDVDAEVFQCRVREGESEADPEAANRSYTDALALWRGRAYEDLTDTEPLRHEARRLEELRLSVLERYYDNGLRLGRHAGIVPELTALVVENPYREEFRAKLMLALYRSGRRADALATYHDGRKLAASDFGLDPGHQLRTLLRQILNDDPELSPPTANELPTVTATRPRMPVPRQLPADLATFTGRDNEIAELLSLASAADDLSGGAIMVTTVDGMAGIGKTALAVHVAHRLSHRYPDGQLFIDLHGFSGDIAPVSPADALDRLLRSLGVPSSQIPAHVDDRAALFRSVLHDGRVLLLLDNAASESQVLPLLPGGPGQLTLVTSRRRLAGIDDAVAVSLDLLEARHGVELFTHTSGHTELTGPQLAQVDDIVDLCGGLPLAIRLAASRLRRNSSSTLNDLHRSLRHQDRALATLNVGDRSVATAFRMSYLDQADAPRRTFRLLSLYPGPHFDAYAAAALADLDLDTAGDHLDELHEVHLLETPAPGRFGYHDLVRRFAAAESAHDGQERRHGLARLFDSLVHSAYHAANLVYPHVKHFPSAPAKPSFPVPEFDDIHTAVEWYEAEQRALHDAVTLAVNNTFDSHAWQLAHAVDALVHFRGNLSSGLAMNTTALVSARRLNDPEILAFTLNNVANCHQGLSQFDAAIPAFEEALELRRHNGDDRGQAAVLNNLGIAYRRLGRLTESAECYESSLALAHRAGDERLEAQVISNHVGVCIHLEQYDRALDLLTRAREVCTRLGAEQQLARVDHWFAVTYINLAEPRRALRHLRPSLAYSDRTNETFGHSGALSSLAVTLRMLGRLADSLRRHQLATELSRDSGDITQHASNLTDYGRTLLEARQITAAIEAFGESSTLATQVDARFEMARAAHAMADALIAKGDPAAAREHLDAAIDAYSAMGVPTAERLRERRESILDGSAPPRGHTG